MSRSVEIINPVLGGRRWTYRHKANRYVKRGHAEWTDASMSAIRFNVHPAQRVRVAREDPTNGGYLDAMKTGEASSEELRNIPVLQAWRLMLRTSRRKLAEA